MYYALTNFAVFNLAVVFDEKSFKNVTNLNPAEALRID